MGDGLAFSSENLKGSGRVFRRDSTPQYLWGVEIPHIFILTIPSFKVRASSFDAGYKTSRQSIETYMPARVMPMLQ